MTDSFYRPKAGYRGPTFDAPFASPDLSPDSPARVQRKPATRAIKMSAHIAFERRSGEIRDSMREIIETQVKQLKIAAKERILTNAEAGTLQRLCTVFKTVESSDKEEKEAQDFSNMTDDELAEAAARAESLLKH